jgi:uncharacterized protein (TIGR01244 family)
MADFRFVTADFAVAPQLTPADLATAAARGFTLIVNNRPDGEAPGQPPGAAIEAAARAAGLRYIHIPVSGRPGREEIEAMSDAASGAEGKALAFCRTGMRSLITWAMGQMASGAMSRGDLVRAAAATGYDLSAVLPV